MKPLLGLLFLFSLALLPPLVEMAADQSTMKGGQAINQFPSESRAVNPGFNAPMNRAQGMGRAPEQSINQIPSMSRAPQAMPRPPEMPRGQQIQRGQPEMPRGQQIQRGQPELPRGRPEVQRGRPEMRYTPSQAQAQVRQYAQQVQRPRVEKREVRQPQKVEALRSPQFKQQIKQTAAKVQARVRQDKPQYRSWFNRDFFRRHNVQPVYINVYQDWWLEPSWGAVAGWLPWGWSAPNYFDEGGYPVPLPNVGYPQEPAPPPSGDWMPLGVFAVGQDPDQAALSSMFVQLAINRSGEIAGTYYNAAQDSLQNISGYVDQSSQQAYWLLSDRVNSPIATTGLYNLTLDQTPIEVHFVDGSDQVWLLVRV